MRLKELELSNVVFNNGQVTVLYRDPTDHRYWVCKCSCGVKFREYGHILDRKGRKGCSQKCSQKRHGYSGAKSTPTYRSWKGMRQRCENPNNAAYQYYGGRGINYCTTWRSFNQFLADMGECPEGMTLERKNVHLGYTKSNCKWASIQEQNSNKTTTRYLTLHGKTQTLHGWADELGIKYATLANRYRKGWEDVKILTYIKGALK